LPPFLTVPETAAVLRLGRSACYDAITRGQIPNVRFGKKLRVPRAALFAFAREQLVSAPAEQATDQQEQPGGGTTGHTEAPGSESPWPLPGQPGEWTASSPWLGGSCLASPPSVPVLSTTVDGREAGCGS
jgi:excisionase family DNA binding protein